MRYAKIYLSNNIPSIIKKQEILTHILKKISQKQISFTETDEGDLLVILNYDL